MSSRPSRSPAEWASFAGSLVVVLAVVALLVAQALHDDRPAAPTAQVDAVRQVGDLFHVDVTVRNEGDETAADVQVNAELTVGDEVLEGDQVIDFLNGGQDQPLTFVFDQDPSTGDLAVTVTGYADP